MGLALLLDEDMSDRVAVGLRARGIDAISVHELGRANARVPDEDQLIYATARGRVLVTYNRRDFQALDARWRTQGRRHGGIIWCLEKAIPRRAIGDLIRALTAAANEYTSLEGLCLPVRRAP